MKDMFNRKLKERVMLLEHENETIIKALKKLLPLIPLPDENEIPDIDINTYIGSDAIDYDELRLKYRKYTIKFDGEL